jgi:hypothetical protein
MEILKPLLKLLGMPGRQAKKEAHVLDKLPQKEPTPIDLSASQREQIERRIAEFIGDSSSVYAYTHAAIARLNALPLYFDWTAFMALCPDGQIIRIPYDDEPGDIEVIREERLRNLGLSQGTKLHPELQFLLPRRPPNAIDCPICQGKGKLPFPESSKHLADTVICSCGGVGWLPRGE